MRIFYTGVSCLVRKSHRTFLIVAVLISTAPAPAILDMVQRKSRLHDATFVWSQGATNILEENVRDATIVSYTFKMSDRPR